MEEEAKVGRLRIRTKLLLGLLAIVVLMVAVSWLIIWQQSVMERSLAIHDRMSTIERYLLECRRQEKNFLLRHDESSVEVYAANLDSLVHSTTDLFNQVTDPATRSSLGVLAATEKEYGKAFEALKEDWLTEAGARSEKLWPETVATARKCHALVDEIKAVAISEFNAASAAAHRVGLLSIIAGAGAALVIAAFLTRSIVGPLESLRALAERVSTGDIQDMDVEFSDLEMKRFNSREAFDLARSLQRMVTSMRLLVSTERGLMDDYHMTIVVLANKALGPSGQAVIERARSAARFDSFAKVDPSNVGAFLMELEKEASGFIPKERIDLLCDAIRELKA